MNRFHYGCVGGMGRRRRRRRAERSGSYSTKKRGFFVLAVSLSVVRVGVDGLLCHTNDGG